MLQDPPRSVVNEMLSQFASDQAPLALDPNGICALTATMESGEEVLVAIEVPEHDPVVLIYSIVGEVPDDAEGWAAVASLAMEKNLYQTATQGGALAILAEMRLLLLCYMRPLEGMQAAELARIYDTCVSLTPVLRQDVLGDLPPEERSPDGDAAAGDEVGGRERVRTVGPPTGQFVYRG